MKLSILLTNLLIFKELNENIKKIATDLLPLANKYEWDWVILLAGANLEKAVEAHDLVVEDLIRWLKGEKENGYNIKPESLRTYE